VEGCARTAQACEQAGIEFFPATELTAEMAGTELHLLGYGFDTGNPALLQALHTFQQARQERIVAMVERLNRLNVPLRAEEVLALANCRSPGRPHVARALVARGVCSGVDEAFARFLKKGRPAWVPKAKVAIEDAIRLLQQAGGVAVLAHPGLNQADPYVPALVEAGLDGLECLHSKHTAGLTAHYRELAGRHGLLITGGSDCHGMAKGQPLIGTIRLDSSHLGPLREAIARRHATAANRAGS
ncbi:MAG: histidinol phosphatase, partial [Proteobacteria bacterium]|nr:histidinol phosphatase [Pseudomonadota bacterium]